MNGNKEILDRLDTLIRLSALSACGDKSQKEKIQLLASVGMQPKAIAELLGTTANTVNVTLSGLRKKKKKARTKKAAKPATNDTEQP